MQRDPPSYRKYLDLQLLPFGDHYTRLAAWTKQIDATPDTTYSPPCRT